MVIKGYYLTLFWEQITYDQATQYQLIDSRNISEIFNDHLI